uniref:Uncharacterized protein n=1 Tax=Sphaerodactylus townsendi TaxID=933632 RepID=A0ACB8FFE1_9SAUR
MAYPITAPTGVMSCECVPNGRSTCNILHKPTLNIQPTCHETSKSFLVLCQEPRSSHPLLRNFSSNVT